MKIEDNLRQRLRQAEENLADERARTQRLTAEIVFMRAALDASETIRHGLLRDLLRAEGRRGNKHVDS